MPAFPRLTRLSARRPGKGIIIESNFLSGKIKVRLDGDANSPAKVYTKDEIKVLGPARRREQKGPADAELKKLEEK